MRWRDWVYMFRYWMEGSCMLPAHVEDVLQLWMSRGKGGTYVRLMSNVLGLDNRFLFCWSSAMGSGDHFTLCACW